MRQGLVALAILVGLIWAVSIANLATGGAFSGLGIRPRSIEGLFGLVAWPFLHGSMGHLFQNTPPLLALGTVVALQGRRTFLRLTAFAVVAGGLCVWVLGQGNELHIGASGLVFGYFGYVLARGYFDRRFWSLLAALLVAGYYGGLIVGIWPGERMVSWEGHLGGFLAGIAWAGMGRRRSR